MEILSFMYEEYFLFRIFKGHVSIFDMFPEVSGPEWVNPGALSWLVPAHAREGLYPDKPGNHYRTIRGIFVCSDKISV